MQDAMDGMRREMRVRTRQPTGPDDITLHVLVTGRHVRSRGFLNEFLPSRSGGGGPLRRYLMKSTTWASLQFICCRPLAGTPA